MLRKTACVSMLTTLILVVSSSSVSAQTVVITHTDRGWYDETGFHDPSNLNYAVGDIRATGCTTLCRSDLRNFFVFDLAGVTQPIAAAQVRLFLPLRGPQFSSPDPSENYELRDVFTPIDVLRSGWGGLAGVVTHADLGSGLVYGSRTITAADIGSMVEIDLNSSAIAALDSATGLIGIGGSLTTLDAVANAEYVFGTTGIVTDITELRLTLVPEPSSLLLIGIGAISLLGYRRRDG